MRTVRARMTAAVLLAGLAASAASAQFADGDLHAAEPKPKAWWEGWFGAAPKPPEHKPETVVAPAAGRPVAEAAARQKQARADWNRRQQVCDQLEIALGAKDEKMQAQIQQLRDRAWEIYQRQTSGLVTSTPADGQEEKP